MSDSCRSSPAEMGRDLSFDTFAHRAAVGSRRASETGIVPVLILLRLADAPEPCCDHSFPRQDFPTPDDRFPVIVRTAHLLELRLPVPV
jgi:hypothetical protein